MSFYDECPGDYEARRRAQRDAEDDISGWGRDDYRRPYDCDHANDVYRREYGYRADELEEDRRAEQRRREQIELETMMAAEEAERERYEREREQAP